MEEEKKKRQKKEFLSKEGKKRKTLLLLGLLRSTCSTDLGHSKVCCFVVVITKYRMFTLFDKRIS